MVQKWAVLTWAWSLITYYASFVGRVKAQTWSDSYRWCQRHLQPMTYQICLVAGLERWIKRSHWGVISLDAANLYDTMPELGKHVSILPARRVGRRRWQEKQKTRPKQAVPPTNCMAPSVHWYSDNGIPADQIPTLLTAHPLGCYGAVRSTSMRPTPTMAKIKGRYNNQIWTADIAETATWAEAKWQLALRLKIGSGDIRISYQGRQVSLQDHIPKPNQHGHIHVDVEMLPAQPGQRSLPRRRSRTPARSSQPQTTSTAVQSEMRVLDLEALYIQQKTNKGTYVMRVTLEDVASDNWHQVNSYQIEVALKRLYPHYWDGETRLCFTTQGYLLRPDESIGDSFTAIGQTFEIVESPPYGAHRRPPSPDGLSSDSTLHSDEEIPPDQPHMYVLWRFGDIYVRYVIYLPRAPLTMRQFEQLIFIQHPCLTHWGRLLFMGPDGSILPETTIIRPGTHPVLTAYVSQACGAVDDPHYQEALAIGKRSMDGHYKQMQLKLLLRGEPGLTARLCKHSADSHRCRQILQDLFKRYGMSAITQSVAATHMGVASPPHKPSMKESATRVTMTSTARRDDDDRSWQKVPVRKPAQITHKLIDNDWSVPVVQEVPYQRDGIILAETQQKAEDMARAIGRSQCAVAILSIRPLLQARDTEPITFRTISVDQNGRQRERALTGVLNQMGEKSVQYREMVMKIGSLTNDATSMRIHLRAEAARMTSAQWDQVSAIADKRAWMDFMKDKKLTTIDCWDIRRQAGVWTAAVRIRKRDMEAWLAEPLPATISLPPETADNYRVHWDSEVKDLTGARTRFAELPGYAGVIFGKTSIGVRIIEAEHDNAMTWLGRTPGQAYEIRGAPVDSSAEMIEDLIAQMHWTATLTGGRRVYRNQATYRVKSLVPPPCEVVRSNFAGEIVQVQIAKVIYRREHKDIPAKQVQAPATWAAAERRAVGVQLSTDGSAGWTPDDPQETVDEADPDDDQDDDDMGETEMNPVDENLRPIPAVRPWARRAAEPNPKVRRTDPRPAPEDDRVSALVQQVAQLAEAVAGLTALAARTNPS